MPLIKNPKEILAMEAGKVTFANPPPMSGAPASRNNNKYYDFHGDKGHNTEDYLQLKRQTEEAARSGRLAHLVKEIKQGGNKASTSKTVKKTEAAQKDKGDAIFMVQSWGRNVRSRGVIDTPPQMNISFPPLNNMDIEDHPMVICAEIGGHDIHYIYVDGGSASEILYEHFFLRIRPEIRRNLIPAATSLVGFSGEITWTLGQILLRVTLGKYPYQATVWMNFLVVRPPSKTRYWVVVPPPSPVERIKVAIHPEYPEQSVMLGGNLINEGKRAICKVLKANLDVFAWKPADITGVPKTLVEHKLGVKEGTPPVRQKKRGQAPRREEDEEKTAFHTSQGVFCYTKMPFRLKNAGATYPRLVDKAFNRQIGRNLEVYVDDIVIQSHSEAEVVRDIKEIFRTLRKINMKLNPQKCTFGAVEGMFLGHNISKEGALRKATLFGRRKKMAKLPTLTAPIEGKTLIMYLSAAEEAVSAVLLAERGDRQMPIYFVGRALHSPEVNYTRMEKIILALVYAARRLRRYFQAHPIAVVTDQPIRQILSRTKNSRRFAKWPYSSVKEDATSEEVADVWKLFTDGSSNEGGFRAGLILTNPGGVEFTYALCFEFKASNNKAEYEALLAGLRNAKSMGVKHIEAFVDSKLVANQINNLSKQRKKQCNWNITGRKGKSTTVKDKSKAICDVGRNSIPEVVPWAMAKMCWHGRSQLHDLRDSQRFLQHALRPPVGGAKINADGILLADDAHGRPDDICGPFPGAAGKVKFLIVAVDYFTKWIEAKPVAAITGKQSTILKPEDLVYNNNEANRKKDTGKLGPKWEGPYEIVKALGDETYKLRDQEGQELLRTPNIVDLKRCYV
nr:reverse transcriptase domain-containing protein [Tanacetum cinerariifolium]